MSNKEPSKSSNLKRWLIAIAGGSVLLVGIIAIPYPGPGWLIVFAGLAILAQEFTWAHRFLIYSRLQYTRWNEWVRGQNIFIKSLTFIFTSTIVVVTIWILNGYGILNNVLNLNLDWLNSPFVQ